MIQEKKSSCAHKYVSFSELFHSHPHQIKHVLDHFQNYDFINKRNTDCILLWCGN